MARRHDAHAGHIPLKILQRRLRKLEHVVARRQALGHRQPHNKIPLHVLERRLHRLAGVVARRA